MPHRAKDEYFIKFKYICNINKRIDYKSKKLSYIFENVWLLIKELKEQGLTKETVKKIIDDVYKPKRKAKA